MRHLLLVSGTEVMFDFIHELRPGYHDSCFCPKLSNMDWIYPLTWNNWKKKSDKIYEKVVFEILDIRPEGQWGLREGNKRSESYSGPRLTVWRVLGLLHREGKSRHCQGSLWVEEMEKGTKRPRVYGVEHQTGENSRESLLSLQLWLIRTRVGGIYPRLWKQKQKRISMNNPQDSHRAQNSSFYHQPEWKTSVVY